MEKHTSGTELWLQQTAVAGDLFLFCSVTRKGDWPEDILERGQISLGLRIAEGSTWWLPAKFKDSRTWGLPQVGRSGSSLITVGQPEL